MNDPEGAAPRGHDLRGAQGVLLGDFGVQINYFDGTWTAATVSPPLADESGKIESPYRGLSQFEQQDARFFFGRETAAKELVTRISEQLDESGLLVVSGVSGAGKSSLVRAGVLPRIRAGDLAAPGSDSWPCLVLTPTASPLDELAAKVAPIARTDPATIRTNLTDDPASFALTARQAASAQTPEHDGTDGRRLILVVDQFEQLFTRCQDETQRRAFITALHAAATGRPGPTPRPGALVVLVLRADFEPRCAEYPELDPAVQDRYLLTSMTERQLRLAITEPAKRAGATVEDDLVDKLLHEMLDPASASSPGGARRTLVSGAGALPLLSHALAQAWRERTDDALTLADYERTGGIESAVSASAERAYHRLTLEQRGEARRLFSRLVATDGGVDTANRVTRTDLMAGANTGEEEKVLETFAAERLLALAADTVEISHEVLVTAWPRLRGWLAETRADRMVRTRLRQATEEWHRNSREGSYLYQGALLDNATETADRIRTDPRHPPLSEHENEFLDASARARQRGIRARRLVTALLTVLAVATTTLAAVTVASDYRLAGRLATANAETLGRESQNRAPTDIATAAQLALAAWRSDPRSPQARTALANAYLAMPTLDAEIVNPLDEPITTALVNGDTAVLSGAQNIVVVTGITGPAPQRWEMRDFPTGSAAVLSPDGRWLAYLSGDGLLRIRDLLTRSEARTIATDQRPDGPLAFSPDSGRLISMASEPRVWEVASGASIPNGVGPRLGSDVAGLWLTPDPTRILVRHGSPKTPGTRVALHSLADGSELAVMPSSAQVALHGAAVVSCEPAPDTDRDAKPTALVTHLGVSAPPTRLSLVGSLCSDTVLFGDGGWLITEVRSLSSGQAMLRLTDLRHGRQRQVTVRPFRKQPPDDPAAPALAVSVAAGEPLLFLVHGTSLLRLRTVPAPDDVGVPSSRRLADGNRYLSLWPGTPSKGATTVTVEDSATGQRIAMLPGLPDRARAFLIGNSLWVAYPANNRWRFDLYEVSPLRKAATFEAPAQALKAVPELNLVFPDRRAPMLLTVSGGILSALDAMTGQPLGPPVTLSPPDTKELIGYDTGLVARPKHHGQVAVVGRRDVQIWDALSGRKLATIPVRAAGTYSVAFDPSGERVAVNTEDETIEIWDVQATKLERPPIPSTRSSRVIGFDSDGYLDIFDTLKSRLAFIDVNQGREYGATDSVFDNLETLSLSFQPVAGEASTSVEGNGGILPYELPLTAKSWHDRLCAAANRPFSPAEVALLPRDNDTSPPC